ncbi:D-beta-hydroxybutyrate dehydrogenase, mitochondrial [Cimex lectularius]|uniref:Uncharacterized protein n=1 Tax=Cimex lectularius TaxID=79782 RepID=A0A8I6S070_CIMLE|nr:D-beta-hydroxybutyrate dehydrogenase, mitochondrial [Cimex lectularius]
MKPGGERQKKEEPEVIWDLIDRCLLPLVFSHAAAVISATVLNTLYISQISVFSLFLIYILLTLAVTLFYHNLKVTCAGKCVVLSGCENNVGYAIAKYLDELGMTVFAGFAKETENRFKLKNECSGRLQIIDLDVTSEKSVQNALKTVNEQTNNLWGVVNAAFWSAFGETEWVPLSVFRKTLEVNLLGSVALTNAFLPLIRKSKGRVVNIISVSGRIPSGIRAPICIVTSALEAYTTCLRQNMRRWGVDTILVETGITTTSAWYDNKEMLDEARSLWQSLSAEQKQDYGKEYFESRITTMKEYQHSQEDLTALLRSVGDAVCRTFPLSRYTPVTRTEKLQSLVASHLPHSVYSILYE